MRATELLIAIGAGLGFASADVVCNPKALHDATQVIDDTANEGFKKSVEDLCSTHNIKNVTEGHFGSITLGLNRTCSDCTDNAFCAQQFDSIINKCVAGQILAGGTAKFDGMTAEVSIDASLIDTAKAQDFRKLRVARMVKRGRKKTTRPKSKPKKGKTPVEAEKPKTTPNKSKTKPKPKACRMRKNPNKTTPGKKTPGEKTPGEKTPGEKTPGKKGPKNALRSVISKLFLRAPPPNTTPERPTGKRPAGSPPGSQEKPAKRPAEGSGKGKGKADEADPNSSEFDPGSSQEAEMAAVTCWLEDMYAPEGWNGEVFFGQAEPPSNKPSAKQIQNIAGEAWHYIAANADKLPYERILVVAALYVPSAGQVYLGTIPHPKKGGSENQFEEKLPSFTKLARELRNRKPTKDDGAKYHAEDAAMWYAFKQGAVGPNEFFPRGSIMAAFGSRNGLGSEGVPMAACDSYDGLVTPTCEKVLENMLQKYP